MLGFVCKVCSFIFSKNFFTVTVSSFTFNNEALTTHDTHTNRRARVTLNETITYLLLVMHRVVAGYRFTRGYIRKYYTILLLSTKALSKSWCSVLYKYFSHKNSGSCFVLVLLFLFSIILFRPISVSFQSLETCL